VEKGEIAEADGALLNAVIEATHDRALVAKAFFLSGAQNLQNWGTKAYSPGTFGRSRSATGSPTSRVAAPGDPLFSRLRTRDEKGRIERHAAGLEASKLEIGPADGRPEESEALAEHVLSVGRRRRLSMPFRGGFGVDDGVDASSLPLARHHGGHSTKTIMATIETLTYAHARGLRCKRRADQGLAPCFRRRVGARLPSTRTLTPPPVGA